MHHILHLAPRYDVSIGHSVQTFPQQEATVHTLYYPYDSRYLTTSVGLVEFYKVALEYVREHKIIAVFSGKDLGSLISALIADHFHFSGPSIESVFLTLHKQLTKKITHAPVDSQLWDITTPFPQRKFPFYLKAPYSSLGSLGFIVRNQQDLDTALPKIKQMLPELNKPFFSLLEITQIPQKYPEALTNSMAIEPLISAPQVTLEGFVHEGQFYPTIMTDTNFKDSGNMFDNFSTPSQFSQEVQAKIIKQAEQDITCIGLNTTFFNAEYWILPDKVLLIEVNARAVLSFEHLYRLAWSYELFENMISLALSHKPSLPENHQQVAGQFNIFSSDVALPAKLLELKKLIPNFRIFIDFTKGVQAVSDHGSVAAQFELAGTSYEEIFQKAEQYRSIVRSTNDYSPDSKNPATINASASS